MKDKQPNQWLRELKYNLHIKKKKTSYNRPKWKTKLSLRVAKKEIVKDDIQSKFSHVGKLLFSRNE